MHSQKNFVLSQNEGGFSEELRIIGSDKEDTDHSLGGRFMLQQLKKREESFGLEGGEFWSEREESFGSVAQSAEKARGVNE
jgi:hypothetical protein